ncbi:MAG: glycosyltransferase family 4 protein [Dysgonamonadaceae bacterium]|jgi:glycosyltransferase involved in cell wall biosynthesis|nr:glycosyltransferase family 4 protein [Dysgonamonadaceae bacterium]
MKINFIVPSTSSAMGGGIRVIFRHADFLSQQGHDVAVYVPMLYHFGGKINLKTSIANTFIRRTKVRWTKCSFKVKLAFMIKNAFIRDADIVIATAFYTAPYVYALSAKKGKKIYFIQDYEVWGQDPTVVDNTYRLDMKRIVITKSLHNLLYNKFGVESDIVYNGHAKEEFLHSEKTKNNPKTVMMLWNNAEYKGSYQALEILKRMHKKYSIGIRFFSVLPKPDLPDYVDFYHCPKRTDLIKLYRQSEIYLFPSTDESWGLPVIEAMANKCAVVGMSTGCLDDSCEDGKQALIAENGDYLSLESKLEQVIQNDDLMSALQQNGYDFSLQFSWEKQCRLFEDCLIKLYNKQ